MNNTEKTQLKNMMRECLVEQLVPIKKDIRALDKDLNNHLKSYATSYAQLSTDVKWLIKLLEKDSGGNNTLQKMLSAEDKQQDANIDWLKWGVRLIIATLVTNAIGLIFVVVKLFL